MSSSASAASLATLDQLVAQLREASKPLIQHVASMLRSSMVAFDAHVADNDQAINQVGDASTLLADRVSNLESRATSVTADRDRMTLRIDNVEALITTLDSRIDTAAADGAKTVAELTIVSQQ